MSMITRHRFVPVSVGQRGAQVERPNCRDPVAVEQRQCNDFGRGMMRVHPKEFYTKTGQIELAEKGQGPGPLPLHDLRSLRGDRR
jgi:hypothetical protein